MIAWSWEGGHTTVVAAEIQSHPQAIRERSDHFNGEGVDYLGLGRCMRQTATRLY
jgi:hypothetical protein